MHGRGTAVVAVARGRGWCSEVHHGETKWNLASDTERRLRFVHGSLSLRIVAERSRIDRAPLAGRESISDRCVNTVEPYTGFHQPLPQLRDGFGVVVVEVGASGKQLDRLEPIGGHLRQVLPTQTLIVIQMRGDAEVHNRRGKNR